MLSQLQGLIRPIVKLGPEKVFCSSMACTKYCFVGRKILGMKTIGFVEMLEKG